ncbi:MAG: NfeD family protein [Verrucomicrobiaceae bacterium]|nr:MAG: NfeD family protein [Verrucomicrobiaceae bacterium]
MQSWHLWTIAGLVLITLEMVTPAFFFASFSAAALLTAPAAALGVGLTGQLGIFAAASVICMAAVRPFFVSHIYSRREPPVNVHALLGQSGTVVDAIGRGDEPGRVKVGGEEWRAVSFSGSPIEPGTRIEITAVSSATLTVRPRF